MDHRNGPRTSIRVTIMADFTREQWHAYLDDALTEAEMARWNRPCAVPSFAACVASGHAGARPRRTFAWRHLAPRASDLSDARRLSSYLFQVHDEARQELHRIPPANGRLPVLRRQLGRPAARQKETEGQAKERRKRFFASSAGLFAGLPRPEVDMGKALETSHISNGRRRAKNERNRLIVRTIAERLDRWRI